MPVMAATTRRRKLSRAFNPRSIRRMATTTLLSAYLISTIALAFFIVAMIRGWFDSDAKGARVIFGANEIGTTEDPAASPEARKALQAALPGARASGLDARELAARALVDDSSRLVTFVFMGCAVLWLLVASATGLIASIKLHSPDWLGAYEWLSFGRIRTLHLNSMAYGFLSTAGFGIAFWLLPRLLKAPLQGARLALFGGVLWNAGLVA